MATAVRSAKGAAALVAGLSLLGALPASPVSAAPPPPPCVVTNTTVDPDAAYGSLQGAVDAATAGDRLTVRNVCHGPTTIDRDLTIVGIQRKGKPRPTLDGDADGSVITVNPGVTVTIRTLVLTDGSGTPGCGAACTSGGAIFTEGTLTLRDVLVRGNVSSYDGAIANSGTLTLAGTTTVSGNVGTDAESYAGGIANYAGATLTIGGRSVIRGNTGGYGGGLYTQGSVLLAGAASIRANRATIGGGGIYNDGGDVTLNESASIHENRADGLGGGVINALGATLTLNGSSSIHHNRADAGGGVFNPGGSTLTLGGTSSIRHNHARLSAGGIFNAGALTLAGSSSVHHNRSDGHASAIYAYGPTLLSDDASVHDNDSHATRNSGAIEIPGHGQTFTMEDASSVRGNIGGPRGGGIVLWPACDVPAVVTGAAARTRGNTPAQIVTKTGTGDICD